VSASRTQGVMGIPWTVTVRGAVADEVVDAVFAELRAIDAMFSTYIASSAVTRIRDGRLRMEDADPLVREVRDLCAEYAIGTNGYFSAWLDGRFDPTGLVKGWAIARAAALLDGSGCRDYFVDGAGDVLTRGDAAEGRPWRVGIRHPLQRARIVEVIRARGIAVATSGTYERGTHIRDPHSGLPATDLLGITVVGPDIVAADAYATAAFAMGARGLDFIESVPGYEALAIDAALAGACTSGFDSYSALADERPS
jgi:FAD:protein FMN transferase